MGKRQHQKDKMYLTYSEWSTLYGGKISDKIEFRRLPFDHCSITFQPLENPYCDREGNIFELSAIIKYIKQFKCNPVTGKPIDGKSLVKLNFHKNSDGKYECPVLFKQISPNSHIAAIATTGNVYLYEAVDQLNIKGKNWTDLLTGEKFQRTDIIVLQDPVNLQKFNIEKFHHVKNNHKLKDDSEGPSGGESNLKHINKEARAVLDELKDYKTVTNEVAQEKKVADKFNTAHYSTGAVAAGFTSTVMAPETVHQPAIIQEDDVRYSMIKKKGYVRLVTNQGPLNIELHCDIVPKTCENFIKRCLSGYYNNTIFHRSIRHFILQGGDPTGTGFGGESIWGKPFPDEFKFNLTHSGRGVLSMANSGPDTNKSQFFITYRSCKHLNNKHTVFGQVVGGLETLSAIEAIEVDNKDRPIQDIVIEKAQVFVDPYQEVDQKLQEERAEEISGQLAVAEANQINANSNKPLRIFKAGVGKYIDPKLVESFANDPLASTSTSEPIKKKKKIGYSFSNFDNW